MMKNIALPRPASSAIAAFLVLSTPAAFAQEAPTITMTPPVAAPTTPAPTPETPPTVAEPVTPAPVMAPQTATPAPAPVIRVPLDLPQAETTAAPSAAERAETAPPVARTARAPSRPATTAPAATASTPVVAPDEATDAASAMEIAPVAADTVVPTTDVVADSSPVPAEAAATAGDFPWEIVGGIAALLGLGGAGLMMARRRRSRPVENYAAVDRPETAATRVDTSGNADVTPAFTAPAPAPISPRSTPAFAAAPHGSMGRHEAMAIAGPTADNPFLTLSKRLKRARFYDRQERLAYDAALAKTPDNSRKPVSAWEIAQRAEPAAPQQHVYRPEPGRTRPAPAFRPGYSRS
ncbi:MAG: hypothetical protein CVT78_08890 [Alphaproteobacteria bacterium HGW-Alphaproteobacteria-17]|nr:MAG: hypothetical protein CVT78_08890 [Alphaproteobacteria bacterium HGW-Alphaproteobacteria-17]